MSFPWRKQYNRYSMPAFQTTKNELDNTLGAINDAAQTQTKKITGNAEDKQKAGRDAIDAALALIGPAKSYARATANNTLYRAINYNRSSFRRYRHGATIDVLTAIRDTIQANAAALADYGITAAQISEFTGFINAYSSMATAPRNAINAKSVTTKALCSIF
jgi:hypothetical protein